MPDSTTIIIGRPVGGVSTGSTMVADGSRGGSVFEVYKLPYYSELPSNLVTYNGDPVTYEGGYVVYTE